MISAAGILLRLIWQLATLLLELKATLWIKKMIYKRRFKEKTKNLPPSLREELVKYYEERIDKYTINLKEIVKMMSSGKQRLVDEEGLEY